MAIDLKNMDKKKIGIIVIAIIAGLGAVALMNTHINTTVDELSHSEEIQQMVQRIGQLEQNTQSLYQQQEESKRQLQQQVQSMRTAPAPTSSRQEVSRQSLAIKTPPGKRALTIKIETLKAVGGLLNPGDFVDILAHLNVPADLEKPEVVAKTILTLFQNIQILAIGANVNQMSDFAAQQSVGSLPITFAVDPHQAELLAFVEKHGRLQLVLRGPAEKESYKLETANWATFSKYLSETQGIKLDIPVEGDEEAPRLKKKSKIEIIRGGAVTE